MRERPNIVMIVVDQWRGDCAGILGNPNVDTPNLDGLFSFGTVFDSAFSAVPSCIAARASLLTGMEPKHHGRVGYRDRVPWNYENTLPGELAKAGYHTHCVGKMHVFPARSLMGFHSIDLHDGYLHNERCRDTAYELLDDYLPWLKEHLGGMRTSPMLESVATGTPSVHGHTRSGSIPRTGSRPNQWNSSVAATPANRFS